MREFLAGINFLSFLIDLVSPDTTMTCFFLSVPWNPFWGFQLNKLDPEPITVHVIPLVIMLKLSVIFVLFCFVYLIVCLYVTSLQHLRSYRDRATAFKILI